MVAGDDQQWWAERPEVRGRSLVFAALPAVRQVATRDNEIGAQPLDQAADFPLERRIVESVLRPQMQVGNVKDAR